MELGDVRCPRCGAEMRGVRCARCSPPPSIAPAPARPPPRPPLPVPGENSRTKWLVRGVLLLFAVLATSSFVARCGHRPDFLALRSDVDGPSVDDATTVVFLLHGYGGSISSMKWLRSELRKFGLDESVAIVSVDGPYSSGLGRSWGDTAAEERRSVERLQALVHSTLADARLDPSHVVALGFSQGAGIAADLAAVEPQVGALASLSACRFPLRAQLLQRTEMRFFLAHGDHDSLCRVSESRSLSQDLEAKGAKVQYLEFPGDHEIPPQVVSAVSTFLSAGAT